MQLTKHFTLEELTRTSHKDLDNTPSQAVIVRLTNVAHELEKVHACFGAIVVSSGYRSPDVNKAVGGAATSAHVYGCAADIEPSDKTIKLQDMLNFVVASDIPYDQVILEHAGSSVWLHIGLLRPGHEQKPRKEALVYKDGAYSPYVATVNYGI